MRHLKEKCVEGYEDFGRSL